MVARLPQNITGLLRASCTVAATLFLVATMGCDRHRDTVAGSSTTEHRGPTTNTSVAPTTLPATLAAATTQPTTGPASNRPRAAMMIDERRYDFPPAILRIKPKNDRLLVLLMSDDPKDALDENYNGNSFYLEMPVEAADVKDLSSAVWHYVAPSSDRTDTPDGIFLDGNRKQLQASNVTVHFEADATDPDHPKAMAVDISGTFLLFDTHDDNVPPKVVPVVAHLAAEVKLK
jgi:hypothetical protein